MLPELDIFDTYRWLLATVCTIYVTVISWQTLVGWLEFFASSRYANVAGHYTLVLLLRVKIRRFAWELMQIVGLCILFCILIYWHHLI